MGQIVGYKVASEREEYEAYKRSDRSETETECHAPIVDEAPRAFVQCRK